MKRICITFAGVIGSSKTPISNYLSTKLNLPIFNYDAIRSEVIEDLGTLDQKELRLRRNIRLEKILKNGQSFICDVSVDREWKEFKKALENANYDFFIISMNLTKELITKLYTNKGYTESLTRIDELIQDHNNFLETYNDDIGLNINDKQFIDRLEVSYQACRTHFTDE